MLGCSGRLLLYRSWPCLLLSHRPRQCYRPRSLRTTEGRSRILWYRPIQSIQSGHIPDGTHHPRNRRGKSIIYWFKFTLMEIWQFFVHGIAIPRSSCFYSVYAADDLPESRWSPNCNAGIDRVRLRRLVTKSAHVAHPDLACQRYRVRAPAPFLSAHASLIICTSIYDSSNCCRCVVGVLSILLISNISLTRSIIIHVK